MKVFGWASKTKRLEAENAYLRKENADMLEFVRNVLESNLSLLQKCIEFEVAMGDVTDE